MTSNVPRESFTSASQRQSGPAGHEADDEQRGDADRLDETAAGEVLHDRARSRRVIHTAGMKAQR